jgi:hypothetical protein
MQFSPTSYHIIPLRSKYSPQHPVLKHPQCRVSSSGIWRRVVCRVATQQTTRRHIPEDDTLHTHRCGNL